ncbi:MAG: insulinase family protein, partial [Acidobacteria bacterium]|nr:insulinase family protein [Acidobacteriota bacterium]
GSMEDLDAATIDDVREFFRIYYAPNNAVLTIVGDFDPAEARSLVEKYFATIPRQPAPPAIDVSEPPEVAARVEAYQDRFAQLPALMVGWKIPPRRTDDFYALSLASELLLEGESSRLYQRLVKGDESVVGIQGGIGERRGPSSLYLFAIPKPGHEMGHIQEVIRSEIKRLAAEGPMDEEMEKLRNNLLNDAIRGRQSSLFRAQRLAEYALYDGDPNLLNTELERYLSVTPAQIKDAVARHLQTDNYSAIEIVPSPPESRDEAPSASTVDVKEVGQPGAPPPQVPPRPPAQPGSAAEPPTPIKPAEPRAEVKPQHPADAPRIER